MTFLVARIAATAAALLALSGARPAHTGAGATSGFVHGFAHPVGGIDHVLAMVAVGLYAALLGGRALWLVPASFVGVMALGGALGIVGVAARSRDRHRALGRRARTGGRAAHQPAGACRDGAGWPLRDLPWPRAWRRDAAGCVGLCVRGRVHAGDRAAPRCRLGARACARAEWAELAGRRAAQAGGGAMALAGLVILIAGDLTFERPSRIAAGIPPSCNCE